MKITRQNILHLAAVTLALFLLPSCTVKAATAPDLQPLQAQTLSTGKPAGYTSSVYLGNYFLAAGTAGRLDQIDQNGKSKTLPLPTQASLLDIHSQNGLTLICGEKGTLLYSRDLKTFQQANIDESGTIFQVTEFNGRYYAAAEKGRLWISQDGQNWQSKTLETDNDIIAIASNSYGLMAITGKTDLFTSADGENWKAINFNEAYNGYYDRRSFTGLSSLGDSLFIYGQMEDNPGEPFIMFTDAADVWFFKALTSVNGEEFSEQLPLEMRAVGLLGDQLLIVCDRGRLLTITECTVCHQMSEADGSEWNSIAMGDSQVLLVGKNFEFKILDENSVRQFSIGSEQALNDYENGAVLVDVRSAEERAEGYIPGSLHIPVAEISQKLPSLVPDKSQEIIFYCAAGVRAQTALEEALSMGYETVYNLGGIKDWNYDIVSGSPAA
ncbi:rhodanese-like domain-containing protein [Oscillospiraceae bacterium MB08-C2-2]|nr:rhodanese-like domain-containing protein [Oscillospiraceae bacterium MB08-C2-2]